MKRIAVITGSERDKPIIDHTLVELDKRQREYYYKVLSAHRNPDELKEFVIKVEALGVQVFIAAAGMAAALPGVIASHTDKPVIGIPIIGESLNGMDSLLSIVQMPRGVPVATMAIGMHGAINAAIFADQILTLK